MIPVYKPWLTALEKKYVTDAVDSSWISSTGKYVEKAEDLFANFIGVKHCIVTTSGTTALHLCFRALDLPHFSGDTRWNSKGVVFIPDTTFIASAFAASYDQRDVQLIDSDPDTWNMDLGVLEDHLKQGWVADAVMPVHLYGNPVDMEHLQVLAKRHKFKIIEDACESLGATIQGKKTGAWGDMACFSFYGNKTFTCGEGGAAVTDDDDLAYRARLLRGQAQDLGKRYWHIDVGYNYRMTNVQAAILCGQLERADEILAEKQRVADRYMQALGGHFKFQKVLPDHEHSNWLVTLELPVEHQNVCDRMRQKGVDVRKVFYPLSEMPPYEHHNTGPVSKKLSRYGLSLPSYPELTNAEIDHVCESLLKSVLDAKQNSRP
jgi:perosamine synthetase